MDGKKMPQPPFVVVDDKTIPAAVQQATGWALFTACGAVASLAFGHAVAYALAHYDGTPGGHGRRLLDEVAIWLGLLCCALLHVAVEDLAQQFPCRRALAYLPVVVTVVVLRCVALPDAHAAEQSALWFGWLCCSLLQAAAAAMALRIPCRRRALAFLALVVTFVGHCMYAAGLRRFLAATADPGFLCCWIVGPVTFIFLAGGDLVYFLDLLRDGR